MSASSPGHDLYVAPNGKNTAAGSESDPLDSLETAITILTKRLAAGRFDGPITVYLRGGRYELAKPITITPDLTGPITFTSYPGEQAVIDGGRRITDWTVTEHRGKTCWVADLSDVRDGRWNFRSLFVEGRRAERPRFPHKNQAYRMKSVPGREVNIGWGGGKGDNRFICEPGDFKAWHNLADVQVVVLHWWIEERMPVVSFDAACDLVQLGRESRGPLTDDKKDCWARYYVDNVFEALDTPGQWYLDRPAGKLYYLPLQGQTPDNTQVIAPRLYQLVCIHGQPTDNRLVEHLRFENLTFAHTDWRHPGEDDSPRPLYAGRHDRGDKLAASAQGASDLPGVIQMTGARHCAMVDCTLRSLGWYAVELNRGCHGIHLVGNHIHDLGTGGIRLDGGQINDPPATRNGYHLISDNHIHHGGEVFHSAIGVLAMNTRGCTIAHNHIHDFYYSGISCGWLWGFQETTNGDNHIIHNHIHDLGKGWLSDMGGIYTLGVQAGSVIRGNLIHDINMANYGAWCIYPDEGSSHLVIEHNVCFETNDNVFHQHYGRENIVRNNIFAFGAKAATAFGRECPEHRGFTFERNIVLLREGVVYKPGYKGAHENRNARFDLNCYWDITGQPPLWRKAPEDSGEKDGDFQWWQRTCGQDQHSIVADPKLGDLRKGEFQPAKDSPVWALGFEPIDMSNVGVRPKGKRSGHAPRVHGNPNK